MELEPSLPEVYPMVSDTQREWVYQFIICGSIGMIGSWISEGMKQDVEDVSAFLAGMISQAIASVQAIQPADNDSFTENKIIKTA